MTSKELNVGVVGLGYISQNVHLRSILSIENVNLRAICDIEEECVVRTEGKCNVTEKYCDPKEMAEESGVDCVIVATKPDNTHPKISNMFLEAGIDVFCEKAMATTLKNAKKMVETAKKEEKILMIGFNRRFMPISKKAKEILKGKELDAVIHTFNGFSPKPRALLGNPHPVDLLRHFCEGEVTNVECTAKFDEEYSEQSIVSTIDFDSNVTGVLVFENNCGGYAENVVIHGGKYSVAVDMITQTTSYLEGSNTGIFNPQEWARWKPSKWLGFEGINGFKQELEEFFDCVRTRRKPKFDAEDAYKSHVLVDQIYKEGGLPGLE